MVRVGRFELPTRGLEGRCSIQLSYTRIRTDCSKNFRKPTALNRAEKNNHQRFWHTRQTLSRSLV